MKVGKKHVYIYIYIDIYIYIYIYIYIFFFASASFFSKLACLYFMSAVFKIKGHQDSFTSKIYTVLLEIRIQFCF